MDDRLRALERARGDSPEAEAAWLAARLRAGAVDAELLRAAALAGYAPAALALEGDLEIYSEEGPDEDLANALQLQPPAVRAYVAAALGRALLPRIAALDARRRCQAVVEALSAPVLDRAALRAAHEHLREVVIDHHVFDEHDDEVPTGGPPPSEPAAIAAAQLAGFVDRLHDDYTSVLGFLDDTDQEAGRAARAAAANALGVLLALGVAPTEVGPAPLPEDQTPEARAAQAAIEAEEREWYQEAGARGARQETLVKWICGLTVALLPLGLVAIAAPVLAVALGVVGLTIALVVVRRRRA
jgi:hypothetical protein